jgi:hypothetical protein
MRNKYVVPPPVWGGPVEPGGGCPLILCQFSSVKIDN